ncbi:MAG TPA: thioesterase family protein [Myxococcaceae bacterium]|nr:thioesterase family protein [Myxococcaceae bacterium]
MLADFEQASAIRPSGPGAFEATVPDGWQQGRGAFGGLVYGLLARAMEAELGDPGRRLQTLAGDIAAPVVPGTASLHVEVLRRGAKQSNLQARLSQSSRVLAVASGVFSAPREVQMPRPRNFEPPDRAEWDQLPVLDFGPPLGPDFARAYEYRSAGPAPLGGARDAETAGYIRERALPSRRDAPSVIALLDAWWPTLWSIVTEPRPVATTSFVAELLVDPARLDPAEPLFHDARMAGRGDGFFVELRALWSGDTCVAMNQQTFAVLR